LWIIGGEHNNFWMDLMLNDYLKRQQRNTYEGINEKLEKALKKAESKRNLDKVMKRKRWER